MSEVNIPLLRKAIEWAEAEAAKPIELCEWNQLDWVATHEDRERARREVARRNGEYVSSRTRVLSEKAPDCGTCYCIAGFVTHEIQGVPVGGDVVWSEVAQQALGIDDHAAVRLFLATNTIEDVRRIAESIAGERL